MPNRARYHHDTSANRRCLFFLTVDNFVCAVRVAPWKCVDRILQAPDLLMLLGVGASCLGAALMNGEARLRSLPGPLKYPKSWPLSQNKGCEGHYLKDFGGLRIPISCQRAKYHIIHNVIFIIFVTT